MNQIIFISGWGTDPSVWNPVLRDKSPNPQIPKYPNIIMNWWECLSDEVSKNKLYKLLSESDSPCILVGWSLGGMIALSAAIAFSEKVSGLVLISSSAKMVQDKDYIGVSPRLLKAMKFRLKTDKTGLLNDFAVMGLSPLENEHMRKVFVDAALEISSDKLSEGLSYLQNCDLRNRLKNITVPVNIVHGECDEIMNPANAYYLEENLSNVDMNIVVDGGHFLIHSNPEIIIESIEELLNSESLKL